MVHSPEDMENEKLFLKILLSIQSNLYPYLNKADLKKNFFYRHKIPIKPLRILELCPVLVNFITVKSGLL